jgi:hypothetical protein
MAAHGTMLPVPRQPAELAGLVFIPYRRRAWTGSFCRTSFSPGAGGCAAAARLLRRSVDIQPLHHVSPAGDRPGAVAVLVS